MILVIVLLVVVPAPLYLLWSQRSALLNGLIYNWNLRMHSKSLPYPTEHFVGRENEMENIAHLFDFSNSDTRVVSIVGPPGIGKSTIAIRIGHKLVEERTTVYYVDMVEASSMLALAEKVLEGADVLVSRKNITLKRLIKWAEHLQQRTVLILDNCDGVLLEQKDNLQKVVKKLLKSSHLLKVLMTSRQRMMQLGKFQMYELQELPIRVSCTLLQTVAKGVELNQTLCATIANLTGNVPLALQVVGSLLTQLNSPGPMAIVRQLEKQLIRTLSPEELPPEDRVNVSIYLSYQYLTPKLQKIGRYLASFPGSFDHGSACEVLRSLAKNLVTRDYISKSVNQLVQRSLLEYNHRKSRFQFHTLIRQFFLDAQKSVGANETQKFSAHFQLHYSQKLKYLNSLYAVDHVRARASLDVERHNIQHLLSEVARHYVPFRHKQYLLIVGAIQSSITSHFLNCRFTAQELWRPLKKVVNHLSQTLETFSGTNSRESSYIGSYVSVLILSDLSLADLAEELPIPRSQLVKMFDRHVKVLQREEIESVASRTTATEYYLLYNQLSNYCTDPDCVKKCHAKILKVTAKLTDCEPTTCSYYDIGTAYYFAGNYKDGARFLELALKQARHENDLFSEVSLLNRLRKANLNLDHVVRAEENLAEMIALFPRLMSTPSSTLYQYTYLLQNVIRVYRESGRMEEAISLGERQLAAIREIGAKTSVASEVKELAEYFFEQGNYTKAADLAQFGRDSMKHLSPSQQQENTGLRLNLEILVGRAIFHAGNYSEGLDYIEVVMDNIYQLGPSTYPEQYMALCPYALIRLRFGCVRDDTINTLLFLGKVAVFFLFESPLDMFSFSLDLPPPRAPISPLQMVQLSPSTALVLGEDKLAVYRMWTTLHLFGQPLVLSWLSSLYLWIHSFISLVRLWFVFLLQPVMWVLQFQIVRVIVRLLFIYLRLRLIIYVYNWVKFHLILMYYILLFNYYLLRIHVQLALSHVAWIFNDF